MITGMNHAVLYVRDARAQQRFYADVLGFATVIERRRRARSCSCARRPRTTITTSPSSSIGADAGAVDGRADDASASTTSPGRWRRSRSWRRCASGSPEAGALVGASDHGANKSLYAVDPDGLEFEVM